MNGLNIIVYRKTFTLRADNYQNIAINPISLYMSNIFFYIFFDKIRTNKVDLVFHIKKDFCLDHISQLLFVLLIGLLLFKCYI
jgi:hypothetical protein